MKEKYLSNMVITKIYSATTMYSEKGAKAVRENRLCWGIIIKYEGETVYTVNGKKYISNLSNMVILPKGCTYEWNCTKGGHFAVIEFESEDVYDEIFCFPVKNPGKILKVFKDLEYNRTVKKTDCVMESIRDTYTIILKIMQDSGRKYIPMQKQRKVQPAVEYIAKNYNKRITNDYLAALCGMSTVYFRKIFSETIGKSPINYINELKINKAKEMLKSDYASITDIAQCLGYLNIYDFSRAFKKYTGTAPSKY